jgi:electron transfer flavoprotein beta subunit
MEILVCVKRVPAAGGRIVLTDDGLDLDTRFLGFTISPHEECAVEEAVRLTETHGGSSTVLTLGPPEAEEQLRSALSMGAEHAVLIETDGRAWDALATARAIVDAIRGLDRSFDVLLFGNDAADSGDFQVGVRVATALGLPCVTGIKSLGVEGGVAVAGREVSEGTEVFEIALPAVFTVKEGINLPRYPSVPGRLRAKKKEIARLHPDRPPDAIETVRFIVPSEPGGTAEILGTGPEAAPRVVELLRELRVVAS